MSEIASILKALGHQDRLRILALLSQGDLAIGELTQILGMSQPRVTQYVKTLEQAGIIERLREGSWVFSRLSHGNAKTSAIISTVIASIDFASGDFARDSRNLQNVRDERAESAKAFFAKVANDRDALSAEYLPRGDIETHMRDIVGAGPFDFMVDMGTGTGRILQIFADRVSRGSGIDSSPDMLRVARANLGKDELTHLSVRSGDLTATPFENDAADLVTLHQVLHFLERPELAIAEASRVLSDKGALLLVDFALHEREDFREQYAHRRLGFDSAEISGWLTRYGLALTDERTLAPEDGAPPVKLWLAKKTASAKGATHG